MAKLLWDPTRDENALVQDFIWGYYGKAASAIAEYDAFLVQAGKEHAKDLASPPGGIRYKMDLSFLSKDFLDKSTEIFSRAKAAAKDDPETLKRVERGVADSICETLSRARRGWTGVWRYSRHL